MLNIKKGLALVLAAATAFTFAPVANLGVTANAATSYTDIAEITMTTGGGTETSYDVNFPNYPDGAKFKLKISNRSLVDLDKTVLNNVTVTSGNYSYSDGYDIANGSTVTIKADPNDTNLTGDATLELYAPGSSTAYKTWVVHVVAKSGDPTWEIKDYDAYASATEISRGTNTTFYVKKMQKTIVDNTSVTGATVTVGSAANGTNYEIRNVSVPTAASEYVTYYSEKSTNSTAVFKFTKAGTATVNVTLQDTTHNTAKNVTLTFVISEADSTMKIDDTVVTNNTDDSSNPVKTITLTADKPSADIGATLADAQSSDEKLTYTVYRVYSDGKVYEPKTSYTSQVVTSSVASIKANTSNDLDISGDKVTAKANALNAVEQYYDILVTNNLGNKAAWVRVVSIRNTKVFTTAKVTVDGNDYEASASYDKSGNVQDGETTKSLELSTKDFANAPFTALQSGSAMPASQIASSDTSVVEVSNGALVAKKVGTSVVTFSAKSDTTHYGNATIKLNVTVTDKYVKPAIDAENISLTVANNSAIVAPKSTPSTTYSYEFGSEQDGKWVAQRDSHLTLTKNSDGTATVKYDGKGIGTATLRITGAATKEAAKFISKDITVDYTSVKASALKVTTKALKLNAGETGSIVATGAALTYTSSDEDIATVNATTGEVTAVSAGVAVITVSDAGNSSVAPATDNVIVTVKAVYKNPAKVTGVKVTNAKGAKVTVKFTKDSTNQNMKYYVQKKVSGKTSGKSVGSNKTTLSVKKGATVKVRVKAYYYDANGTKHVGAYSSWKTLKTDKK